MSVDISANPAAREHSVHFYEDDAELAETVGGYLADAARAGAALIVVATESHRRAFEARLEAAGVDLDAAIADGRFISLDAAATLEGLTRDGRVNAEAFDQSVGEVIRRSAESGRPICAYGEMVALLWEAGNVVEAIELEKLWNALGRRSQFSLLCAYHSEAATTAGHIEALGEVCDLHSSVSHGVTASFGPESSSPRAARRFVADALRRWGDGERLIEAGRLVVSELATNAVLHAGTPFWVSTRRTDSGVRISVHDENSARPEPQEPAPTQLSGRGLQLVSGVSDDWGVEATAHGKVVWAELRR